MQWAKADERSIYAIHARASWRYARNNPCRTTQAIVQTMRAFQQDETSCGNCRTTQCGQIYAL
jgi:hypothetical protein